MQEGRSSTVISRVHRNTLDYCIRNLARLSAAYKRDPLREIEGSILEFRAFVDGAEFDGFKEELLGITDSIKNLKKRDLRISLLNDVLRLFYASSYLLINGYEFDSQKQKDSLLLSLSIVAITIQAVLSLSATISGYKYLATSKYMKNVLAALDYLANILDRSTLENSDHDSVRHQFAREDFKDISYDSIYSKIGTSLNIMTFIASNYIALSRILLFKSHIFTDLRLDSVTAGLTIAAPLVSILSKNLSYFDSIRSQSRQVNGYRGGGSGIMGYMSAIEGCISEAVRSDREHELLRSFYYYGKSAEIETIKERKSNSLVNANICRSALLEVYSSPYRVYLLFANNSIAAAKNHIDRIDHDLQKSYSNSPSSDNSETLSSLNSLEGSRVNESSRLIRQSTSQGREGSQEVRTNLPLPRRKSPDIEMSVRSILDRTSTELGARVSGDILQSSMVANSDRSLVGHNVAGASANPLLPRGIEMV